MKQIRKCNRKTGDAAPRLFFCAVYAPELTQEPRNRSAIGKCILVFCTCLESANIRKPAPDPQKIRNRVNVCRRSGNASPARRKRRRRRENERAEQIPIDRKTSLKTPYFSGRPAEDPQRKPSAEDPHKMQCNARKRPQKTRNRKTRIFYHLKTYAPRIGKYCQLSQNSEL